MGEVQELLKRITARMSACSRMSWSIDPDSDPLEHSPNIEIFTCIKVVGSLLVPFLRHETKYQITTTSNERRLPGLKTYPVPSAEPPSHHLVWLPYPELQGPDCTVILEMDINLRSGHLSLEWQDVQFQPASYPFINLPDLQKWVLLETDTGLWGGKWHAASRRTSQPANIIETRLN